MTEVYSKPNCVQCNASYRALDAKGNEYEVFDLTQMPEKLEEFKAAGHLQAPIIVTDGATWHGFRPDLISQYA